MENSKRPKVVIIGAGFGGLWAVQAFANAPVDVQLIDKNNYHTFQALLYQVAAGELEPESIAYPIRGILRKMSNISFIMAEVTDIDLASRIIKTDQHDISYDYLIVAAGSVSHFFGVPGAAEYAFSLKTLEEGIAIRNHILKIFEHMEYENDENRRKHALTFTIVGGGATGVEYSGALNELVHNILVKDFPKLPFKEVRVILIEASDSLLSSLPASSRAYTLERLRGMGIEVMLKSCVSRITPDAVYLKDGTIIPTETVIWTAGVQGNPLIYKLGIPTTHDGRVKVLPTLQLDNHPEVYIAGDLTFIEQDGKPLPMVAQVAMQQGTIAAKNILLQIDNQPLLSFHYKDLGAMVTIGRHFAVARIGEKVFTGLFAWLLWLVVHLIRLIGFRNRLLVLINWARNYFLYERAVRLVLPQEKE